MAPLDALLLGAMLLGAVLLGVVLLGAVLLGAVASVPLARKLGAPSVAARPWSSVAHVPLPVGVSATLGQPVAL